MGFTIMAQSFFSNKIQFRLFLCVLNLVPVVFPPPAMSLLHFELNFSF